LNPQIIYITKEENTGVPESQEGRLVNNEAEVTDAHQGNCTEKKRNKKKRG